jgi:hypothetical protein
MQRICLLEVIAEILAQQVESIGEYWRERGDLCARPASFSRDPVVG